MNPNYVTNFAAETRNSTHGERVYHRERGTYRTKRPYSEKLAPITTHDLHALRARHANYQTSWVACGLSGPDGTNPPLAPEYTELG